MFFVDEPEVFLHSPQAFLMGKMLAKETPRNRQLFIATHSTDVLRGLLDEGLGRIKIVRITRTDDTNDIKELQPDDVKRAWKSPLLRFSKVLDGLFHDGVVVCEGDADCRFFSAMVDAVTRGEKIPDLAYVHGAGLSRIPSIIKSLRPIGVPVRVVADFDVLRESKTLQAIYESLGGDWPEIEKDVTDIQNAIAAKRPELPLAEREIRACQCLPCRL
jgi:predicted ATP-dependent endonuclease of OLD family